MGKNGAEQRAKLAADDLELQFGLSNGSSPIGLILGTGWGDVLSLDSEENLPFTKIVGFTDIHAIEGHKRVVSCGRIGNRSVIALRGRIHLNEAPSSTKLAELVRLQVEMLVFLGVRTFILTNAAGGLAGRARVGDVVMADGFVSLYAPDMPLYAGEFCSPDDVLDPALRHLAREGAPEGLVCHEGGYAMVRGPFFEGRKYDKEILRQTGAHCIGMSTLPEACIISLHRSRGARALALSYITNDDQEEHSHEENVRRAKEDAPKLGQLLANIVHALP